MIEASVLRYEITTHFGIVAPAATPASIVDKLNGAINEDMSSREVQTALENLGVRFRSGSPADFATKIAADLHGWRTFAAASKLQID